MADEKRLIIEGDGYKEPPTIRLNGVDGVVTEAGIEWDSPQAEEIHTRLWDQINRHTEKVMAGAHAWDAAARQRRAEEETAEMRRQARQIYEKHTRTFVKVNVDGAGE